MLTKISTGARSSDHRSSDAYNTPHLSTGTWVRNIPGACTARPQSVPLSVLPQGMLYSNCLHTGGGTQTQAAHNSDARSAVQLSVFSCSYRRCTGCSTLRRPQRGAAGPPSRRSPLLSMPTSWPLSPRRSGWPPRTHRCPPCGWFLRGRKGDRSANGPTSAQDPAERNSHHHCP